MAEFWQSFSPAYSGWGFMWILLIGAAFVVALGIERALVIRKARIRTDVFMREIRNLLEAQDLKKALALTHSLEDKPFPRVLKAVLTQAVRNPKASKEILRNAAEEEMFEAISPLEARLNYLAMMGNVSTLIGLMGTIYGLILSFRSVSAPGIDAAEKSRLLAHGIAVAMNTTLFGLAIAIPAILIYTYLNNQATRIIDEIETQSTKVINLLTRGA